MLCKTKSTGNYPFSTHIPALSQRQRQRIFLSFKITSLSPRIRPISLLSSPGTVHKFLVIPLPFLPSPDVTALPLFYGYCPVSASCKKLLPLNYLPTILKPMSNLDTGLHLPPRFSSP